MLFYFGCYKSVGHYLINQAGRLIVPSQASIPWEVDEMERLCPPTRYYADEKEGRAALHHRNGWTALAFWDRSVDTSYNSKSVFLAEGNLEFDAMIEQAQAAFPQIWKRFQFEVSIHQQPPQTDAPDTLQGGNSGGGRTANLMTQISQFPSHKLLRRDE